MSRSLIQSLVLYIHLLNCRSSWCFSSLLFKSLSSCILFPIPMKFLCDPIPFMMFFSLDIFLDICKAVFSAFYYHFKIYTSYHDIGDSRYTKRNKKKKSECTWPLRRGCIITGDFSFFFFCYFCMYCIVPGKVDKLHSDFYL